MKIINNHHLALLKIFQDNQNIQSNNDWVKKYLGTTKKYYGLKTDVKVRKVKAYLKAQNLNHEDIEKLLLSLSQGDSFEELSTIGLVLNLYPDYRNNLKPEMLDKLLDRVEGWAETDTICQLCFTAGDILSRWSNWEKLLKKFVTDPNIHKRRASLVLLTKPLRQSDDPRLSDLALANTGKLKHEKDILITKAVSWILRSLIKFHTKEVENYLNDNLDTLPKIAIRETRNKLATGTKSGK
ncbi:MAG: DNA alkylation repair protein [Patescibacteria group bacterium]|jgi:3-methyladenine DNA glycosylase AlkD